MLSYIKGPFHPAMPPFFYSQTITLDLALLGSRHLPTLYTLYNLVSNLTYNPHKYHLSGTMYGGGGRRYRDDGRYGSGPSDGFDPPPVYATSDDEAAYPTFEGYPPMEPTRRRHPHHGRQHHQDRRQGRPEARESDNVFGRPARSPSTDYDMLGRRVERRRHRPGREQGFPLGDPDMPNIGALNLDEEGVGPFDLYDSDAERALEAELAAGGPPRRRRRRHAAAHPREGDVGRNLGDVAPEMGERMRRPYRRRGRVQALQRGPDYELPHGDFSGYESEGSALPPRRDRHHGPAYGRGPGGGGFDDGIELGPNSWYARFGRGGYDEYSEPMGFGASSPWYDGGSSDS